MFTKENKRHANIAVVEKGISFFFRSRQCKSKGFPLKIQKFLITFVVLFLQFRVKAVVLFKNISTNLYIYINVNLRSERTNLYFHTESFPDVQIANYTVSRVLFARARA